MIKWDRQTEFVEQQLINRIELVGEGTGWREERTGLHENESIETRRHWLTDLVPQHAGGGVNVIKVLNEDTLLVDSPTQAFKPFVVYYADTCIIPA